MSTFNELISNESSSSESSDEDNNTLEEHLENSGKITKKKQRTIKMHEEMLKESYNRNESYNDGISKLFSNSMQVIN